MKNQKIIILAGADISDYEWLSSEISHDDFVICADSGLRHAHVIGVTPDIIIGDFDSVDHALLSTYEGQSEIIHDPDQYSTDLMKAIRQAMRSPIFIYAALGQRADHEFGTYLTLLNADAPDRIILKNQNDTRRVITKPCQFDANIGDMVGVFPLKPIKNLSYKGLQWPAEGIGPPYDLGWNGACNPVIDKHIEINIDSGAALVTRSCTKEDMVGLVGLEPTTNPL